MESLCNFSCCFDVKKDILSFVKSLRDKLPPEATRTSSNGEQTGRKPDLDVRIVGQERFNEVLFVWDDMSSFSNEEVTHVGLYDPAKQTNSVLFVHESKLNIVSCTMNQEHSMIAYVTLDGSSKGDTTKETSNQKEKEKEKLSFRVYRAFLAEICPQHRIFDLNVERSNLLRVQFLWNRQPKDRDSTSRESRLLFLLHNESLGLYILPLARVGNKVMMSGPPDTLQLLKQFIWAQWDVISQRLFVVLMKSQAGEEKLEPILRCLEFNSKTSPVTKILELTLPFPIKYSTGLKQYSNVIPSRTMSESSFNMEVIFQASGSLCICYQHPTKPKVHTSSTNAAYPDISTVHTTETSFVKNEEDSSTESVEHPSRLSSQSIKTDSLTRSDHRRRAVLDISDLSHSTSYTPQVSIHQARNLEFSNDLTSKASSAKIVPHPLTLSTHAVASDNTQSPLGTPKTPIGAFTSPSYNTQSPLGTPKTPIGAFTSPSYNTQSPLGTPKTPIGAFTSPSYNTQSPLGTPKTPIGAFTSPSYNTQSPLGTPKTPIGAFTSPSYNTQSPLGTPKTPIGAFTSPSYNTQSPLGTPKTPIGAFTSPSYNTQSPLGTPKTPIGAFNSPIMWGEREIPSPVPNAEKQDLVDLNYSVLILHHMTVLHCSVPQIPRVIAESTKLYFTPLESYILVYSPGHLMHLLNISPEVVPCLHVAFHRPSVPITPIIENNEGSIRFWDNLRGCQTLTHINRGKTGNTSGDCIFNVETGKAFRVSINKDVIPQLLVQANCHSVKLALVHLVTVHLRDSVLLQKVMKELSMDVTDLDLSELMAEHLIGATFSASRRQFDRDTLRLLQFTNTDITRGQLVETTDGERLVSFRHCSYTTQPQIYIHRRDWMERRLTMEVSSSSLWETLEQRVSTHSIPPDPSIINKPGQRFHPRTIELEIRKQRAQSMLEGGTSRQGSTQRTSFFKKMAASARRVMTPSKKPVITMHPDRDTSWVLMEEDMSRPDKCQETILSLRDWMERRLTMEVSSSSLWETLEQRVSTHSIPPDPSIINKPGQRFHPRTIELEIRKQRAQSMLEGGTSRQGSTQRTSFFKKMAASARRVMTPSKKPVITMHPDRDTSWVLMEEDMSRPDKCQETILSLTLERLISHFERYSSPSVSREKMINMAQEYLTCQLQQVKQLVLLMLHSCGYPDPRTIPRSTITLNKKPLPMGYQLFHLIERFFMAVQSVCFPLPPGFQTFFTTQGFRCLEPSMFLQYVDHGVLQLTEEFLTRLMQEVPDDTEEQVDMKIQIISRLAKGGSTQALQRWNHPISMQYLAQEYVADTLKEEGARVIDFRNRPARSASQTSQSSVNSGNSDGSQINVASTFPPLSTLLRLLENKDPKVGSTIRSNDDDPLSVHHLDPKFVEKVALRQTVEQYGSDLSTVSF